MLLKRSFARRHNTLRQRGEASDERSRTTLIQLHVGNLTTLRRRPFHEVGAFAHGAAHQNEQEMNERHYRTGNGGFAWIESESRTVRLPVRRNRI
jgi:hypothetical protein